MDDLEAWDSVADAYVAQPQHDWFDAFLDRHLADIAGKRVLDLGCGHGWFTGALHARGADVVGVDGSRRLLDVARAEHPTIDFRHVDLSTDGIDGTFDAVVALMVLMDLPDLSRVRPQLAPGGVLVATMLHPSFYAQKTRDDERGGYREVRGYLEHETWWIDAFGGHRHYHRPLGFYVEWLASLGLGVVELLEPPASVYEGWRERLPTRLGLAARPVEPYTGS